MIVCLSYFLITENIRNFKSNKKYLIFLLHDLVLISECELHVFLQLAVQQVGSASDTSAQYCTYIYAAEHTSPGISSFTVTEQ